MSHLQNLSCLPTLAAANGQSSNHQVIFAARCFDMGGARSIAAPIASTIRALKFQSIACRRWEGPPNCWPNPGAPADWRLPMPLDLCIKRSPLRCCPRFGRRRCQAYQSLARGMRAAGVGQQVTKMCIVTTIERMAEFFGQPIATPCCLVEKQTIANLLCAGQRYNTQGQDREKPEARGPVHHLQSAGVQCKEHGRGDRGRVLRCACGRQDSSRKSAGAGGGLAQG